jgi:hypothetical protein
MTLQPVSGTAVHEVTWPARHSAVTTPPGVPWLPRTAGASDVDGEDWAPAAAAEGDADAAGPDGADGCGDG